jgi:hypothetical protein
MFVKPEVSLENQEGLMDPKFLNDLKRYHTPTEITSENINDSICDPGVMFYETVFSLAVSGNYKTTVVELLKLKPIITYDILTACDDQEMLKLLLEYDPDAISCSSVPYCEMIINSWAACDCTWFFTTLVDYGVPIWALRSKHYKIEMDYVSLVQRRISSCREALLALIRVCKRSKFPALRGIVLCFAKQVWAQRGGDGCGARGHKWIK